MPPYERLMIPMPPVTELVQSPDRGGPAQPLLSVRNLVKHFPVRDGFLSGSKRAVHAVDGVSFDVAKGETLGIVGESGCGKSTTARLMARLMLPDSGSLVFDGEGVDEFGGVSLQEYRRNLQMVFQDSFASLNPRLTMEDTISFGPREHGIGRQQARMRARALLERVGLQPAQFAARYPHELSGGQRQRVAVARALVSEPSLILADEPTGALDTKTSEDIMRLLTDLNHQGMTVVIVTHESDIAAWARRKLVFRDGQIIEDVERSPLAEWRQAENHARVAEVVAP